MYGIQLYLPLMFAGFVVFEWALSAAAVHVHMISTTFLSSSAVQITFTHFMLMV